MSLHQSSATTRRLILCGLLLGIAGTLLFGIVHAIVIVPIWHRLLRGLVYAMLVGVAVTFAYHEYSRASHLAPGPMSGLRFGALFWLAGVPAILLGFGSRFMASEQVHWSVDMYTVALAVAGGAALLWRCARTRRAAVAGGIGSGLLLGYNGGPMPIEDAARAVGLPAGFFVIETVGGLLLALLYARLVLPTLDQAAAPTRDPAPGGTT